ncbi:HI1506-related protein [Escherichia coli]|uniref:HI1506-related protein n=1 Tax=Escherichia coli TaxID=562 RepID=UPI002239068A|nr:HI1506-related protein [Escherichia coli]MCW7261305.1 HI1506-related protein [Escherichia coli]MCW7262921.1 HI1506-related protein [Escherichia coli]MCW7414629.1 HI1506-related protein [Escherichia coli]MCW7416193.1 HI1506-related protein [Escherichia coli]
MNEHHTVAATDDSALQVSGDNSVTVLAEVRCSRSAFRRAGFLFTRGRQQVEVTPEQLARLEAEPCLTVRILQTPADDAGSVAGVVHAVAGSDLAEAEAEAEAGQDAPRKKTGNKAKQAKKARA